jgi:hypothetical protein
MHLSINYEMMSKLSALGVKFDGTAAAGVAGGESTFDFLRSRERLW